jgi:YVTN family beta-propeller protein
MMPSSELIRKMFVAAAVLPFSLLLGARGKLPQQPGAMEPATGLLSSRGVALNALTGKAYAVDESQGAVAIYVPETKSVSIVRVGAGPVAVAVNEATGRAYVVNNGGSSVTVLDGESDAVVASVNVGALPYVAAVNRATGKIFVSNTFTDVITVIDGATNATATLKAGSADTITVDSKRDRAYLIGWEGTHLTVLNSAPAIVGKIPMSGMHLWGVTVDEAEGKAYVTRAGSAELAVVDEDSGEVIGVPTGAIPCAVAVNAATNVVYVVNHGDDSVTAIDGPKRKVIATMKVGDRPQAVAVDTKANRIYVANTRGDSISVIDGTRNVVVKTLSTGRNPYALAVDPNRGRLFVALQAAPSLGVIDVR